ncbi:hypothetical protein [Clostridium sp. 'White wine YQ']|uniref:hypothetical protein n=1 Tax=Clostridium sp. 'White wine YQ' TaxID=3027474 RepID=UPI002366F4AC|nr:hypothetical protein [Clostridium sp. 'White wine YQ']MDD7793170.1 hypothetical protein [Clostridium sp. 'White wine YQ']
MDYLILFIVAAFSTIVFSILINVFNNNVIGIFIPIQKHTQSLKRKRLYSNMASIIFILIAINIAWFFKLGNVGSGLVLGAFIALNGVLFGSGFGSDLKS